MGCGDCRDESTPCRAVLMVVPTLGKRCGISDYSRSLARELRRLGLDVRLVTFDPLHFRGSFGPGKGSWNSGRGSSSIGGGTVVHFQYQYVLYNLDELRRTIEHSRRAGMPSVVTVHEFGQAYQEYNRFLLREFDGIIVHSALMRHLVCGSYPGGPGGSGTQQGSAPRIEVVPMGCEVMPGLDRKAARARLGISPGEPALGFFGFMLPHKGISNLIRASVILKEKYPSLRCFIFAPDAPYVSSRRYGTWIESEVEKLKVGSYLRLFRDYLPETVVIDNLSAMDVVVLPYEDRGMTGVSSAARTVLAVGCPTVVTDTAFFHDLSSEVVKVKTGSPEGIAAAVSRIFDDKGLQQDLRTKMADFVARNSWARSAERHVWFYSEVIHSLKEWRSGE
ncbi:MAG TPA: glycosyltransferase [Firmicutes bacterium]|nr:glycosyltransferase [Bacillota bacterium]